MTSSPRGPSWASRRSLPQRRLQGWPAPKAVHEPGDVVPVHPGALVASSMSLSRANGPTRSGDPVGCNRFVQPNGGFGQCVVKSVPDRADRGSQRFQRKGVPRAPKTTMAVITIHPVSAPTCALDADAHRHQIERVPRERLEAMCGRAPTLSAGRMTPNAAPWGSATREMRPAEVSVGSINTLPPSLLIRATAMSVSATVK